MTLKSSEIAVVDGEQLLPVDDDHLPVFVDGIDRLGSGSRYFLVVFSGAISKRNGCSPPFFSGRRISREVGLPLVAFSDPTLAHSMDLKLAFYAGSERAPRLPDGIARLIDKFADRTSAQPILVGGSGGGFAALNIGQRCEIEPYIFVWNAQTRVSHYDPGYTRQYIDVAFPSHRMATGQVRIEAERIMNAAGACNSVIPWSCSAQTVYLQNMSDWHVDVHFVPFRDSFKYHNVCGCGYHSDDINTGLLLGDWGEGHAAVPHGTVIECINQIKSGKSPREIIIGLRATQDMLSFGINVSRHNGRIAAEIQVGDRLKCESIQFAFYLLCDGKRLSESWYSSRAYCEFEDPGQSELTVVGFIRLANGCIYRRLVRL